MILTMKKSNTLLVLVALGFSLHAAQLCPAPESVVSDAKRMGAEEMNPRSTLGCRERAAGGTFRVLI